MAIEAIKGQQTISELSKQFELTPKQICDWKKEFLSKAASVFTKESPDLSKDRQIHELHARPEIFNTDQSSQFTSDVFIETLVGDNPAESKLKVSMDGRGRATDDIYIERFWRSIKYENIYLNAYETGVDLYRRIEQYIQFYNTRRPHQSLDNLTPDKFYTRVA